MAAAAPACAPHQRVGEALLADLADWKSALDYWRGKAQSLATGARDELWGYTQAECLARAHRAEARITQLQETAIQLAMNHWATA